MGVVYSSKLWDNKRLAQIQKAHHTRHFFSAVVLGLVIGSMASLIMFSMENKPARASVYKAPTQAVAGAVTEERGDSMDKLFPVGNDFSAMPLQKKAEETPPPPPVPDCAAQACLALSFDDGPDPINTPKIMDSLSKQHVPATFFLIGNRVAPNALIVQRMYRQGFEIGNHSWAHPNFLKLTAAQMSEQVNLAQQAVTNLGIPAPTLFRPPYGAVNATVRATIHMPIIRWDVDPKDWAQNDPAAVIANVEAQAKPGGIVLMHSTHAATAAALDTILPNLKSRFQLVTVTQLLQLAPGAQGEYIGR